jgi:transposase
MITPKKAQEIIQVLDEIKESCFTQENTGSLYPFTQWEQKRDQVKRRLRNLPDYIEQAADRILFHRPKVGHPKRLNVVKRTTLFLFTRLMCKSNRDVENLLVLCRPLFGFQASYKYVERLYSDMEVNLVLHNLFLLLLQEEGVSGDFSGDGTGYSLSVTKHYRTDDSKKGYMYVFRVIDIDTGFYVACGYSTRSEMDAFKKALHMLTEFDIPVDSMSLDKYYSSRKVIRLFDEKTMLYLIPKKNLATIGVVWAPILKRMQEDPYLFLKGYYLRNLSESGFSADKRRFGSVVRQKRDDRRETALFSTAFLHNVFTVRVRPG